MNVDLIFVNPKVRNIIGGILLSYLAILGFSAIYVGFCGYNLMNPEDFEPSKFFLFFYKIVAIPFGTEFGSLGLIIGVFPVVITTVSKEITGTNPPVVENRLSSLGCWVFGFMAFDVIAFFIAIILIIVLQGEFADELGGSQHVERVKSLFLAAEGFLVFYLIDLLGIKK